MSLVILFLKTLLCFATVVSTSTSPTHSLNARESPDSSLEAAIADGTICGWIIDSANKGYNELSASVAYHCLISVPLNAAVALRFIEYYNTTLQFQSATAYLKNPPDGYQQPPVDVFDRLAKIRQNVNSGYYKNQYAFEIDVQRLVYSMHDAHVNLVAGIVSAFSFGSAMNVLSLSVDGRMVPELYFTDDVVQSQQGNWDPSPITSFNGVDAVDYLTKLAALNSFGNLEPHADWNQLMASPALDIQGQLATFGSDMTFYPGSDYLNCTFANGTDCNSIPWLAWYNNEPNSTGPLTTGGDFYNYFVLGLLPASYNESNSSQDGSPENTINPLFGPGQGQTSWYYNSSGAYPDNPVIVQPDLSIMGGVVTGYSLDDISTAVLSIPSFSQFGPNLDTFLQTVESFIGNASANGTSRVIIDLQQNSGGAILLAIETFRQFFPQIVPFDGSRRRSHELADVLGGALTPWWDSLSERDQLNDYDYYVSNEWIVTDRLNADTGKNFSSWQEYFGPRTYNGDEFSLTERYDLSNSNFDEVAFDIEPRSRAGKRGAQPRWDPSEIVILTDGLCSSACSLFVEMMTHEAGVPTVVMGGRPMSGPMQAVSGSRGALLYSADALDEDFRLAGGENVDNRTANASLPQLLDDGDRDSGIWTTWAGFNLRDQIRENDTVPLQFKYLAANCRLYYTLANVYNMSRLWRDVAAAVWNDPSLCVENSIGYATSANTTAAKAPPAPRPIGLNSSIIDAIASGANVSVINNGGLQDGTFWNKRDDGTIVRCGKSGSCASGSCYSLPLTCSNGYTMEAKLCLPSCTNACSGAQTTCQLLSKQETKEQGLKNQYTSDRYQGVCVPTVGTRSLGCPN